MANKSALPNHTTNFSIIYLTAFYIFQERSFKNNRTLKCDGNNVLYFENSKSLLFKLCFQKIFFTSGIFKCE